jgi:hypothetical protein
MGNSWLRSRDGNVSVSGCGEPIPPSILFRGRSSEARALACHARSRRFDPGRPRLASRPAAAPAGRSSAPLPPLCRKAEKAMVTVV